ncbi:disks large-associated protein 1-like [Cloeon dipterum]|uniref:disks large-associated protein 1-like n=1 Tax=Cloeon dipterum TaxID=197152 RepID=UPI003220102D
MAFFKNVLCCSGDTEVFADLDVFHQHGEHYSRYLEYLQGGDENDITGDLLKEASQEVSMHFEQLSGKYLMILETHDKKLPEDVKGKIRTACGMSKLLVKEKLTQFDQFVEDYENQIANNESAGNKKVVHLDDLKSFFEIISVQVADLDEMFDSIKRLREHGWKEVPELTVSDEETGLERKGSKMKLLIEPPAPTKNAQADLERREHQRAELRKIMRSQAAEMGKSDDDITVSIYEGKKID